MILFDTHWSLASPNPLYITLIQDADETWILDISVSQRNPTPALSQTKATGVKLWVNYWKCQISSYMIMAKVLAGALSSLPQPQTIPELDHSITLENKKHEHEQGQSLLNGHHSPRPESYHPHPPRPQKVSEYRPYRGDHTVPHILRPVLSLHYWVSWLDFWQVWLGLWRENLQWRLIFREDQSQIGRAHV